MIYRVVHAIVADVQHAGEREERIAALEAAGRVAQNAVLIGTLHRAARANHCRRAQEGKQQDCKGRFYLAKSVEIVLCYQV